MDAVCRVDRRDNDVSHVDKLLLSAAAVELDDGLQSSSMTCRDVIELTPHVTLTHISHSTCCCSSSGF